MGLLSAETDTDDIGNRSVNTDMDDLIGSKQSMMQCE